MLTRGVLTGEVSFSTDSAVVRKTVSNLLSYFMYMVIVNVVAVPEGLPMSVTISLALAMQNMTRANSLVRQLVACETIGSATIICSDKTGTLTQNKMEVNRVYCGDRTFNRDKDDWPKSSGVADRNLRPLDALILNSAINSTAHLERKDGQFAVVGNSTEGALLRWIGESSLDYATVRAENPVLYQVHFSSERKRMTTIIDHQGVLMALVKGAPETILPSCSQYLSADGVAADLDGPMREKISAALSDAGAEAMRTLAFAHRPLPNNWPRHEEALHNRRDEIENGPIFARVSSASAIRCGLKCAMPCTSAETPASR